MNRIGLHLVFWSVFFLWAVFITHWTHLIIESNDSLTDSLYYAAQRIPVIVISTYTLLYGILPHYIFKKRNYLRFAVWLFYIILAAFFIDRLLVRQMVPASEFEFFNEIAVVRNVYLLLTAMGLASAIKLFKLYLEAEKKRNRLKEDNLKSQLNFLRAQFNPHFLYNTLNAIYSMAVQKNQEEISTAVQNLSEIMKYLTYESDSNRVPLEKEIQLVQNFIGIQYLRFANSEDLILSFNLSGKTEGRSIAPVVLLPFAENAFKHGVVSEENCLIQLDLSVVGDELRFIVKNTLIATVSDSDSGIGLRNIRKRLELIYEDSFTLNVKKDESHFITELILKLT